MSELYKGTCKICGCDSPETLDLPLYTVGSEGTPACLQCRLALTDMARAMMQVAAKARKQGYLAAKQVAAAKVDKTE